MKATLITVNDELKTVDVNVLRLEDAVENKGKNAISQLHIFHYDNYQVIIYGWLKGKEKQINKHELPPPIDNILYYGDLLVFLRENDELVDFEKEEYTDFYNTTFGGFVSCSEDFDDDEDNEYDFDDDFLVEG